MNRMTTVLSASVLVASAGLSFAGDPTAIVDEAEPQVVESTAPNGGGLGTIPPGAAAAAALGVVAVAAALSSDDDDDAVSTTTTTTGP